MMHFRTDAASSIERSFRLGRAALATAAVFAVSASGHAAERSLLPNMFPQANASGLAATFSGIGQLELTVTVANDQSCQPTLTQSIRTIVNADVDVNAVNYQWGDVVADPSVAMRGGHARDGKKDGNLDNGVDEEQCHGSTPRSFAPDR